MTEPSEYDRIEVFVSRTGTVHELKSQVWGQGARCTNRFMFGAKESALISDIDCGRCLNMVDA